ncbi:hypothetical protein [Intestinibacter sp.]|uniref:hypothetical protein n=1 Tax=Intestinibacter sp. TaxID=1965304 RepID=UPI002A909F83|nr:hypothetical protein [Intestinibacter sp.]MDY5212885.1 hypothetical protein [Intestinibacter sp.]
MKKVFILLFIIIFAVGCDNVKEKDSKDSSENQSPISKNILQIEDVEGYWECKSSEDDILLRLGWKNDIDIYYSDGSKEHATYNVVKTKENTIELDIKNNDDIKNTTITTNDNGESITFKRNKKEHYFIRIPKDKFYMKLDIDYVE